MGLLPRRSVFYFYSEMLDFKFWLVFKRKLQIHSFINLLSRYNISVASLFWVGEKTFAITAFTRETIRGKETNNLAPFANQLDNMCVYMYVHR